MTPRLTRKLLTGVLVTAVLGAVWFFFAPVSLGGSTTYVVTHGTSMEPRFHSGDLAVVRGQSNYHVGEIVAYDSNVFHTIVLHRIIAIHGDRYVFKGDNNNFVDFEHPVRGQLIGALWIHIPSVGGTLASVGSPGLVGLLVGIGALLHAGASFTRRRRRRGRERRAASAPAAVPAARTADGALVGLLACGLLALLPFVLLALLAFTRAPSRLVPYHAVYHQQGSLTYEASATPGPAYQEDRATTGEPLFTHVVRDARLRFGYRFASKVAHSVQGAISLDATLTSTDGWRRSIPLASPAPFHGDHASVAADLSVSGLVALLGRVQRVTAAGGAYTLAVEPHVSTLGRVGALPLHTTFSPQIPFSLEPVELRPMTRGAGGGASASAHPLTPATSGAVTGRHWQPVNLTLGVASPTVLAARRIALGGIATITLMLVLAIALLRPGRRREGELIKARYGRLIVEVERVWQLPGVPEIDVADMESLVRIAEHYERSILHECVNGEDAFWVTDESGQFRDAPGREAEHDVTPPTAPLRTVAQPASEPATDWLAPDPAELDPTPDPAQGVEHASSAAARFAASMQEPATTPPERFEPAPYAPMAFAAPEGYADLAYEAPPLSDGHPAALTQPSEEPLRAYTTPVAERAGPAPVPGAWVEPVAPAELSGEPVAAADWPGLTQAQVPAMNGGPASSQEHAAGGAWPELAHAPGFSGEPFVSASTGPPSAADASPLYEMSGEPFVPGAADPRAASGWPEPGETPAPFVPSAPAHPVAPAWPEPTVTPELNGEPFVPTAREATPEPEVAEAPETAADTFVPAAWSEATEPQSIPVPEAGRPSDAGAPAMPTTPSAPVGDAWAEQVASDAIERGSSWRAACEAAGVVFTAFRRRA